MTDTLLPTAMNMAEETTNDFTVESQPSLTHRLLYDNKRFSGHIDDLKAYEQAVYKILQTERYAHLIYSWDYGIELKDLFGQPIPYVIPELERRITDALMADDRTEKVSDFEFDTSEHGVVHVKFKATSIYGETEINTSVEI